MDLFERIEPESAWLGGVTAAVVALVVGALAAPRVVYDGFLWRYFWGPVEADAQSAVCAVRADGVTEYVFSSSACSAATGPVAFPGYTAVSEVGYAVTLITALVGVVFLLRRLDIGDSPALFYALFPFMLFGGALRVVEDANDAVPAGVEAAISYPLNTLIISPVIYFTMFAITLAAVVVSVGAERRGLVDRYEKPLFVIGVGLLASAIGYLTMLAFTTSYVEFHPIIAVVVLVFSTLITGGIWVAIERYYPQLNAGTGLIGLVILWGHSVDGVANVVGIDWGAELGLRGDLVPKHPVNRALIGVGEQFPATVQHYIGVSWPFLVVKIVVTLAVLWVFDETVFEDSPRYSLLLLIAILAVGLGPGTRDMLRATFGI